MMNWFIQTSPMKEKTGFLGRFSQSVKPVLLASTVIVGPFVLGGLAHHVLASAAQDLSANARYAQDAIVGSFTSLGFLLCAAPAAVSTIKAKNPIAFFGALGFAFFSGLIGLCGGFAVGEHVVHSHFAPTPLHQESKQPGSPIGIIKSYRADYACLEQR